MILQRFSLQKSLKYFSRNVLRTISTKKSFDSNNFPINAVGGSELDQRSKSKPIRTFSLATNANVSTLKEEKREFYEVFPDVVQELLRAINKFDSRFTNKIFKRAVEYSVAQGKVNRGFTAVLGFKRLAPKSQLTKENIRLAHYLGWCVELLQTSLLVYDDIIDDSESRRGRPCWHRVEGVGLSSIIDAQLIETSLFYILMEHFGHTDYYVKLLELFKKAHFVTSVGQCMEMQVINSNVADFTMEIYHGITANKTSYYSFYFPAALAMHMCGYSDPALLRQAKAVLLELGPFFQIHNDYIDCFSVANLSGKAGNDIERNKCSWLACMCMEQANEAQKEIMKDCYGQKDPAKIERVKQLYLDLGLHTAYKKLEIDTYNRIISEIKRNFDGPLRNFFLEIVTDFYVSMKERTISDSTDAYRTSLLLMENANTK